MDIKDRIMKVSYDLFMKYGIKSVTMDEIAKEASISKKTIYQNFKDKNDLVLEITKFELQHDREFFECCVTKSDNAIEEVFHMMKHIRDHMTDMNPSLLFDLKKFHTQAWDYYNNHKEDCFEKNLINNIQRGKNEGHYRSNINEKILTRMRMAQVECTLSGEYFSPSQFNLMEVQLEIFEHFIRGLVTDQGLKLYNQYLSEYGNQFK